MRAGAWLLRGRGRRLSAALLALAIASAWLRCGPLPPGLLDTAQAESTVVLDRRGVPLYEALSGDGTRSTQLTAGDIPDLVAAATVAAEDRRFWSHYGVDPIAILRAARRNLAERSLVEGGSTITQQAAKLLLLRRSGVRHRGWGAKVREAIVALRLEHRMGKRDILALYLNLASYGNQITGIDRASRAYFGVSPSMLTPAQAAFLAGLPQRPTAFNPYRRTRLALSRQRVVLDRMVAAGVLSERAAAEARQERLDLRPADRPFRAPHFVRMVLAGLGRERPARIVTTIDSELQADVAGIIRSHRAALERHGAANVAVVVLDNARSEWLAWEGSGDYLDERRGGAINGPSSPRQPGSALKPFTYALAFEHGFTPASVLPDVPMHFPTAEAGIVYSPRNYDGKYRGPLLARAALAGSENVPAVSLASDLGVPALLRFLQRAGFSTFDKSAAYYGLGLTLGNAEVRLDELVAAYAAFARGGDWIQPGYLAGGGRAAVRRQLVSARSAFWITDILSDPDARAYTFGRGGSLDFPFPVAVKTGTSQAYHDNWTIGYTRRLTVGVWVGNFDRRPLRNSSGVTGAAPIFQAVMLAALKRAGARDPEPARADDSVRETEICALSGELAATWCPVRRREWLPREGDPPACTWHHASDRGIEVFWPPAFREWAARNAVNPPLAVPHPLASATAATQSLVPAPRRAPQPQVFEIANPPGGATYLLDPSLRPEFQTLSLRVVASAPTRVVWTVDGLHVGRTDSGDALSWPLRAGTHHIVARDDAGRTASSTITVR